MAQLANGQLITWVQDVLGLPQVLAESTGTNTTLYLYGLGRLSQIEGTSAEWFLGDALGSVRQVVDGDGDVVLVREYSPYGQVIAESGSGGSGYGFTGEQTGTGLIYLRARYFDPSTGRFTSKDPFPGYDSQPQTLNPYVYCLNDPVNDVDPSGELPPWLEKTLARIREMLSAGAFRDPSVLI